jgi:serine/threonine-protein kinase
MPLSAGERLGPYEILAPLGAGGMGEVYRAADARLGRDVALKVLPQAFAADVQRMARFQREAQVLASLNHPNIAAIYGLEEAGAASGAPTGGLVRALVMELVEGPTLAERIAQGAIPMEEALPIAKQIAEALEYAHERGIIHRDLKPANIKLTKDGAVKVLDFGLAKALGDDSAAVDVSTSPTLSMAATRAGVILGTAAYMSPEQARGKVADRRADIWAFGVVLYEMLAGRQAYGGETASDSMAAIITREPEWSALPANVPQRIQELLRRCMSKEPRQRLRDIGEARIAIEQIIASPASELAIAPHLAAAKTGPRWLRVLPWAVAFVALAVATIALWPSRLKMDAVVRFAVGLPAGTAVATSNRYTVAVSPDGQQLAFVLSRGGQQQLYSRRVDSIETTPIPGTEGASSPFFSPDGQWVGFVADGKFKKIRLGGGVASALADGPDSRGGTWLADDTIVFTPGPATGLWRVPAAGGVPEELTKIQDSKNERTHRWPSALPGGKAVLFTVGTKDSTENYDESEIDAVVVATGERKQVLKGARMAQYFPATGHLIFAHEGSLFAIAFDPESLTTRGKPVLVVQGVVGEKTTGASNFAVSSTGILFFIPGSDETSERVLAWLDPTAKPVLLSVPSRQYFEPKLSPDGQRVALDIVAGNTTDVWVYDLARNTLGRLTFGPFHYAPVWSADGRRVIYRKDTRDGKTSIAWKSADGTGEEEVLWASDRLAFPHSASPDGKWLTLGVVDPKSQSDIYVLPLTGDRKPQPFVTGPFDESGATFSPDGRWVAYSANETGRYEIYVKPFPSGNGRWQVSTDGGGEARWSPTGKEIIYKFESRYTVVPVETSGTFRPGTPRLYLDSGRAPFNASSGSSFCLSRDGKRILTPYQQRPEAARLDLVVAVNWAEEVRRATAPQK